MLYTSKNKKLTTDTLTRVGFSMPTDLLISGYIGSITYGNENVKLKGKPFNEVFYYDSNSKTDSEGNALSAGQHFDNTGEIGKTDAEIKERWTSDVYAVFKSNQIKSLDPIIYDNKGNVIPLSERFNSKNEDIRYSISK